MAVSARIHGSEHPILKIFSDDFSFTIPPYQRPYSWTTEQAGELLSDLLEAQASAIAEPSEPYFLGSIVLIKQEANPAAEVIDGQQRLTTLTILLSALRQVLKELGMKDAENLNQYIFQKGSVFANTPDRPRLSIRERDNGFFREYIQDANKDISLLEKTPLTDPQKNLKSNYQFFVKELKPLGLEKCLSLAQYILNNCFLVAVSTPNMESAYRIFSVMNDRGMDLSYTDILKSEIIGAISVDKREKYTDEWEDIEEGLGRAGFDDLFSHLRTVYRKVKSQDTLLKELRTYVIAKQPSSEVFIDDVLKAYAEAYRIIKNQDYAATSGAEKVNELMAWLNRVDNADWLPPALAFFVRNHQNPEILGDFFSALERLAAVLMLSKANVNERVNRYAEILTAIEKGEDLFSTSSPLHLRQNEKEKALLALNSDIYNAKFSRYVLLRLDSLLADSSAKYDHKTISIEHVLPQNPRPDSQWLKWFPNEEERLEWTHRLGNLVLLARTKNSQARNFDFDKKKTSYFQTRGGVSSFALTTQVISEKEWTLRTLEKRQKQAVDLLSQYWQITL